jgi:hypothetical protein
MLHQARSFEHETQSANVAGAKYQRRRDLPRLLPLWPHEVDPKNVAEHARLLARIRRALRLERMRGVGGHWAYDLARHAALLRAYRAEVGEFLLRTRAPGNGASAAAE